MRRSCSAFRAGRSTTGSAKAGSRRSARSADRSACCSIRCRTAAFDAEQMRNSSPPLNPRTSLEPDQGLTLPASTTALVAAFPPAPVRRSSWSRAAAGGHRARLSADLRITSRPDPRRSTSSCTATRRTVDALAARYNLVVKRYLTSGAVLRVTAGQLAALRRRRDGRSSVGRHPDSRAADVTAESIGADQVWAGAGDLPALDGAGVGVAVIDSGIDTRHNALKKRVIATKDFTGGDGLDHYGHGTHVAAIIAGQAGKTAETRDYRGIAPGAYLLNLRVLGDDGSGTVSDVIEAIDWAIEHRHEYNIRVINLSLGAPVLQPYRDDPLCEAVERAVRAGIVVVAAAGNYGQTADGKSVYGAITSPANSPYAIAVGAIDTHDTAQRSDDTLATYSSRGPTRYDLVIKPDLAAPGSHIVSAEAAGGYLSRDVSRAARGGERGERVFPAVGDEHGGGGGERRGGAAAGGRERLEAGGGGKGKLQTSNVPCRGGVVGAWCECERKLAAVELKPLLNIPRPLFPAMRPLC